MFSDFVAPAFRAVLLVPDIDVLSEIAASLYVGGGSFLFADGVSAELLSSCSDGH